MLKKIILVLLPPIINNFNFRSEEKITFIDSGKLNKLFLQGKDIEKSKNQDELLNLFDIDRSEEINKIIKEQLEPSLILINYPNTKNHFNFLNQKLAQEGQKIKNIILFKFNYELIASIQNEYLICPICERIFKKEEVIENENFACPDDNNYQFSLEKINKFNEQIISHYLKNSKELIENFLQENNSSSDINQLTISKKEEIFSGEIQKKLLNIIKNI
jgi:adenylate kinase family enzyme